MTKRHFTQCLVAVGAIIEKDGKILLVKEHMPKYPDHNKWNRPAGLLDPGENPLIGVQREIKEETGLDFTPTGLIGIYSLVRHDINDDSFDGLPHAVKLIFRGEATGKLAPNPDEISATDWFTIEEINNMDATILRDLDIKQEAADYFAGNNIPLDRIIHTEIPKD